MYKLTEIQSEVKWFSVNENSVCLCNNANEIFDLKKENTLYKHQIKLQEIHYKGKFFINDLYGKGIYFDKLYNPVITDYYIHSFKNSFVLFSKMDKEERSTFIQNIDSFETYKIKSSSTINYIYDKQLFRKNFEFNLIEAFEFPYGKFLWKFDIKKNGSYKALFSTEIRPYELAKFLGVWQDELLVACEGGLILSLNIRNGKLIRQWDKLPEKADAQIKDVFKGHLHQAGNTYQLNLSRDKIFAIYYRHLVEIDLTLGEMEVKDLTESLFKNSIAEFQSKSGYAEDETHYYTTVHFDKDKLSLDYVPTAVCAVNKETLEIDWYYRFDEDGSGNYVSIQIPQVSNQKLFQHTANKVLFVFEKEKP